MAIALPFALGAFTLIPYVTLRPQAISWLMFAGLLWFLIEASAAHPRRFLLLIPWFALWANLHGLYVVGLGVVGLYLLFTLAGRTAMSPARGWAIAGLVGVIGASMVTPAGPIGILYPLRYLAARRLGPGQHPGVAVTELPRAGPPRLPGPHRGGRPERRDAGRPAGWWRSRGSGSSMGLAALRNVPVAVVFCMPTLVFGLEDRLRVRAERRTRPGRSRRRARSDAAGSRSWRPSPSPSARSRSSSRAT